MLTLLHPPPIPVRPLIKRIREEHAAPRSDPDVIGAVKQFALKVPDEDGMAPFHIDGP